MDAIEVQLPSGIVSPEGWRRDAELRALSGRDELFLLEEGTALGPAARSSALLARCLARLGPHEPVPRDAIRTLTVGDREALLLHLRRLALGDEVSFVLACPDPGCGAPMDLDLKISELLLPPYSDPAATHEAILGAGDDKYRVRFRLPTGADQELASPLASSGEEAAGALILRRCVLAVLDCTSGAEIPNLPAIVAAELPGRMAALDPQAEILVDLVCPECGRTFRRPFDAASCLFEELSAYGRDLHRQVHLLAFNYHWSEDAILAMGLRRRHRYLEAMQTTSSQRRHDG
jgi:hypothetical protein